MHFDGVQRKLCILYGKIHTYKLDDAVEAAIPTQAIAVIALLGLSEIIVDLAVAAELNSKTEI